MLLDNARKKGAEIREGVTAKDAIWRDGAVTGVVATDKNGAIHEFHAPMTIDATGRDALLSRVTDGRCAIPN